MLFQARTTGYEPNYNKYRRLEGLRSGLARIVEHVTASIAKPKRLIKGFMPFEKDSRRTIFFQRLLDSEIQPSGDLKDWTGRRLLRESTIFLFYAIPITIYNFQTTLLNKFL